jgi:predicted ATPase/DNA-binding SARP family transcriptional activator
VQIPWRIELFGGLKARQGTTAGAADSLAITRFANRKTGLLLAYLAYYPGRPHPREALAELLWPGTAPEVGRHNLRQALLSLRRQLEPSGAALGGASVFLAHRDTVQLSPTVTTDVAEFEAGLQAAARAASPAARVETLARAVALFQGDLLPGFHEDWLLGERERLAEACQSALRQLICFYEEAGDFDQALQYGLRAVAIDPLREAAHADLIRLYLAADRPADALRQYRELERLLRQELHSAPAAETIALVHQLPGFEGESTNGRRSAFGDGATGRRGRVPARAERGEGAAATQVELFGPVSPSSHLPAAPSVFPAPSRLPAPVTRFFGREAEIARLEAWLRDPDTRLITLTGSGGAGKTRLAVEVARRTTGLFGGAVWFVPLADRTEGRDVPDAIADALHLPGHAPPLDRVAAFLGERTPEPPALLVLDNFEQLVDEGAPLVAALLERCPGLTCLVTSRQRLEIHGEHELAVLPLPIPTQPATPEQLAVFPSVQLFTDRARATRPDFAVTPRNAEAVALLCERLEGLPLALELAAARTQMLTPGQMLTQLEARFDFLASRRRDITPRHRSLRAAFDWSYELLPAELRRCFVRLSVFQGRWTLEAAEAVCEEKASDLSVLEALTELRDRSLILVTSDDEEMSYRMLETLREYAAEQLAPEERAFLRGRAAAYYMTLAERAERQFLGPEQAVWLDRLEREHDNFRAALAWSQEEPHAAAIGLRLAGLLHFFWYVRGHIHEGRRWLGELLALPGAQAPTAVRATALFGAARLAVVQADWRAACALCEECLAIWRALGDRVEIANTLCLWGYAAEQMGERRTARALFAESLEIYRAVNDRGGLAHLLKCIGEDARALRDEERAQALFAESLALYRELGNPRGIAMMLAEMAYLAMSWGEDERAAPLLQEHLELSRRLKDREHIARALRHLGLVARHRRDHPAARAFFEESLALYRELGVKRGAAELLASLGATAWGEGDRNAARTALGECLTLLREVEDEPAIASCLEEIAGVALAREATGTLPVSVALRAARLLAAADVMRAATESTAWWPAERAAKERCVATVRAALGEAAFAAAYAEGSAMTPEQALDEARRLEI